MNLNEYMVAVDRPLGLHFALAVDGRVFVHSLKRGGNAEKSRIIMVGDTLKKAGTDHNEGLVSIKDLGDTEYGTSKVSIAETFFAFFSYHRKVKYESKSVAVKHISKE
ncbi:phosphoglucan phosphatase LSF1, chloroplastic [Hordeum vulgare]|nr:phosphoglucan phosphatase LSF1, chloroplastic [Hordeum vulgare]